MDVVFLRLFFPATPVMLPLVLVLPLMLSLESWFDVIAASYVRREYEMVSCFAGHQSHYTPVL